MKTFIIALFALLITTSANAARYDITANVGEIRFHGSTQSTAGSHWNGVVWISLENPDKNPNCVKYRNKYAVAVAKGDDSALSIALMAKASNSKILLTLDDSKKMQGDVTCLLQYITLL
ncbi:hypothetical protein [Pseudoalteromonas luteoviolacea]|uniref:Uncharacterized protein n=1 Tax=Pseudoalteromonas luteoviolacea (strain 2ta16) TaxID=1353533 RepID=V4HXS9_PSEL2|nr:hypothetical protein [Pseudoalteromonas luteoviolacea]ESP92754.1 hypothetical protein PL2TA16_03952 [Pseudoalteromonas luteoviolacea 2ta16]KZN35566.1 hypothetical protein N483_01010 [Pseudoalteromonas luteoviolacea NCIMB 1944]